MKKKNPKKLNLKIESIAKLNKQESDSILGGGYTDPTGGFCTLLTGATCPSRCQGTGCGLTALC